ncbi:YgjV family protein [Defluviimonas sp. WL0024]|uniref:YgjV family protein n=2 Tax=Albidovulum TaxID=205889 RepID=A0ABT3J694_9RHOB|nr:MULTISPECIES: YgjV family protein [Defluviimonas]MCU9849950.1 YgjV family protein [Defluviimonas sp. WL0024]MCW3783193.1 YgjV family protein [Defluviimonas salinarum]
MDPINLITQHPAAAMFGAAGLACQLVWPLFSSRRAMLGVQFGIGTNYGAQYALIDAWSGAAVCALGATQTMIALIAGNRPWLRWMGLAFLPGVVAVCVLTWSGLPSFCSMTACSLVMLGRLQSDLLRFRSLMLAAAPFGMGHDLAVGSMLGLAGACLSATLAAVALRREIHGRSSGRAT